MQVMLKACYTRPLALYVIVSLIAISTFAGPAEAMFLTAAPAKNAAGPEQTFENRASDLAKIQGALESRIVRQKLADYGLSPSEALARVSRLSDEQLHALASHTDSLQAGGDAGGLLFGLVVVALLVVVLVYLLQHRIEIK